MKTILKMGGYLMLVITLACSSSKNTATPEEVAALDQMISDQKFEIKANWAQPMATQSLNSIANAGLLPPGSTVSRIDVSSSRGFLRMKGDSIMADLPFFGERRMGGYYNQNNTGIKFEGVPEDLSFTPIKKGQGQTMRFNINQDTEGYQVIAQLYPNGTARLMVASNYRTNIWYQGNLSKFKEEE
ncbi:DUF4251 domain-containing protein [Flagellimonas crocea]|uniref:DUF4251 domain-containing protein n=1 Tax=Flagellimonas crocea TaxID=3067311 RepID=UPI00296EB9DF|nr:DUF4251 domain-containing protein [Muricauda sp. DH64]